MNDIIPLLTQVITDWKTAGALAGVLALVNVLVALTKMASGENAPGWAVKLFGWIKPAWRPWVAIALGVVGGAISAKAAGKSWSEALLTAVLGAFMGLGASGAHEAINATKPTERAKKEAAAALADALDGPEAEVKTKVAAMKRDLDNIAALPDKKARLQALAASANLKKLQR